MLKLSNNCTCPPLKWKQLVPVLFIRMVQQYLSLRQPHPQNPRDYIQEKQAENAGIKPATS